MEGSLLEAKSSYDLFLIDSMFMAKRFHYGIKLSNMNIPVGMLYGIANYLIKVRYEHPHTKQLFLWEGGSSRRTEIDPTYKQNRKKDSHVFYDLVKEMQDIIKYFGADQASHVGLEADDLAGWYVYKAQKTGERILLVTNDHDWWQFVNENTNVSRNGSTGVLLEKDVQPHSIVLQKSLLGDASDGITGLTRFPTKLVGYLCRHCTIVDELKTTAFPPGYGKWKAMMLRNWGKVKSNEKLVKWQKSWVHSTDIHYTKGRFSVNKLRAIFKAYAMNSLVSKLDRLGV